MSGTKRLSENPMVHPSARTSNAALGAYTEVGEMCFLENVTMGDYSYCGQFCFFQNATIGRFSNVAAMVRIGPTRHPTDRPTQHHFTYRRALYGFAATDDEAFFSWRTEQRATIGHDTWLGHGSIVMPNVTVGTGAVVGAGAVVTRDVPPYGIAVGVPAEVVKHRFDARTVDALFEIAWWNWPHETIAERLEDFSSPIDAFIEKYRGRAI
jgi:hypothetical protein